MTPLKFSPVQQVCSVGAGAHFVQIYDNSETLLDCVCAFFKQGFNLGETALMIGTRAHRVELEKRLTAEGYDVSHLKRTGKFSSIDAAETLGLFMQDGRPEAFRFNALVGGLLKSQYKTGIGVRAFGEMVAILWDEGNREGAVELEGLWNDLAKEHSFTLFCAYRRNQFATVDDRACFASVCGTHSAVIGAL